MIKIGIIGCGFIGTALKCWIEQNNKEVQLFISDPAKNYNDDVYAENIDAYFISIHVPTLDNGKQDVKLLEDIVKKIPYGRNIWIRTTILPSTLEHLRKFNTVEHMPEFLTERTYIEDFKKQPMIFTGNVELLKKIFPGKSYIEMTSEEAAFVKYAHNVFGALKVTYFNCINNVCETSNFDFEKVRKGILASGYINADHTQVPGPDGKLGYGGKCFPKDVDAFEQAYRYTPLGYLIQPLTKLNQDFRSE